MYVSIIFTELEMIRYDESQFLIFYFYRYFPCEWERVGGPWLLVLWGPGREILTLCNYVIICCFIFLLGSIARRVTQYVLSNMCLCFSSKGEKHNNNNVKLLPSEIYQKSWAF